jgi:hypothetical protein
VRQEGGDVHEPPEATDEEHEQVPERLSEEEAKSGAGFADPGFGFKGDPAEGNDQ